MPETFSPARVQQGECKFGAAEARFSLSPNRVGPHHGARCSARVVRLMPLRRRCAGRAFAAAAPRDDRDISSPVVDRGKIRGWQPWPATEDTARDETEPRREASPHRRVKVTRPPGCLARSGRRLGVGASRWCARWPAQPAPRRWKGIGPAALKAWRWCAAWPGSNAGLTPSVRPGRARVVGRSGAGAGGVP